jgi:hypothetical protein
MVSCQLTFLKQNYMKLIINDFNNSTNKLGTNPDRFKFHNRDNKTILIIKENDVLNETTEKNLKYIPKLRGLTIDLVFIPEEVKYVFLNSELKTLIAGNIIKGSIIYF